ncbi:hypothetical protein [Leptothermofonsia sp. ETS-13]|uniref:hypothetical protein n=1 Tax=Leptothermofonsia sp. ETS-13 TaxID=3035696 RepID=UPI003B9EFDC6
MLSTTQRLNRQQPRLPNCWDKGSVCSQSEAGAIALLHHQLIQSLQFWDDAPGWSEADATVRLFFLSLFNWIEAGTLLAGKKIPLNPAFLDDFGSHYCSTLFKSLTNNRN